MKASQNTTQQNSLELPRFFSHVRQQATAPSTLGFNSLKDHRFLS